MNKEAAEDEFVLKSPKVLLIILKVFMSIKATLCLLTFYKQKELLFIPDPLCRYRGSSKLVSQLFIMCPSKPKCVYLEK